MTDRDALLSRIPDELHTRDVVGVLSGMDAYCSTTPILLDAIRDAGGTEDHVLAMVRALIYGAKKADTPRLVYADWLDDAGEVERAEFVRVQVELARTRECDQLHCWPDNPSCSGACELRRHESDLFKANLCKWFDERLAVYYLESERGDAGNYPTEAFISRGFIASVTLDWQTWLRHHAGLFWSPRQTVECDGDCSRWHGLPPGAVMSPKNLDKLFKCRDCKGTGRIPRPFVPTAQPITDLILTTAPDISHYDFALRWPDLLCKMIGGEPCW